MPTSNKRKRIASIITIVVYLVIACTTLHFVLAPISYATYYNCDIRNLKRENATVEMAFVGASRVYRSYIPAIFEEELGLDNVLNAGSSSQPICATYYQLKDIIGKFKPKTIIIGVTWDTLIEEPSLQGKLIVYDRLSLFNRIGMIFDCIGLEEIPYCLYAYRFRENITSIDEILPSKIQAIRNNYVPEWNNNEIYYDKGFVYSNTQYVQGEGLPENEIFDTTLIREDSLEYLNKCIALCRDNDIDVQLVTGPTTMDEMLNIKGYQSAVDYYEEYAKSQSINYYNLNYLKNRVEILPNEYMHDYNHVNGKGAEVVSRVYANILKDTNNNDRVQKMFFSTLEQILD